MYIARGGMPQSFQAEQGASATTGDTGRRVRSSGKSSAHNKKPRPADADAEDRDRCSGAVRDAKGEDEGGQMGRARKKAQLQ